ncbi:MAG: ACP S-malonyltransferase [Acidobacteria bacterium]|nr:ACP S-malonyltransferase [Acidobacteriota bacterium]MCI0720299.1 ACP S-malonyltransferase [Acidobacteriota bacterium]
MGQIAFVFPGQGSQAAGMGKALYDSFDAARSVFIEADAVLGFPLSQLCFEGPEEQLKLTENTQPAILAVSVAACRALCASGLQPSFVAGHSLGEYSALVSANSLSFADALRTVRKRGTYMQEAVPVGQGAMAAILGLTADQVEALCRDAAQGEVLSPANLNSPSQIVIAGTATAVERALQLAKTHRAKRAVQLPVSAPFHCALMRPAQERLAEDLRQLSFRDPRYPLINNADAAELREGTSVADSLSRQVCSPVRWTETIQNLINTGVQLFIEVGPGKVLCGLIRQIDRTVKTANVEDSQSLAQTLEIASSLGP